MWIDNRLSRPIKEGRYKTLVDYDGFGSLKECDNEHFNGKEWNSMDSNAQFICYWQASEEDYLILSNFWERDMEEQVSKNFGRLY
jgi:hypothetical protein